MMDFTEIHPAYRISDEVWQRINSAIPPEPPKPKGGRPRMDNRQALDAIFYVLRTGCQWKALPRSLGASSTVHDRYQEWADQGVFERMWELGLAEYAQKVGIDWDWTSMDGAMVKAPLGGEATGANPTDRAKSGTKRSVLTDGRGIPLAVAIEGANRHDMKLTEATLEAQRMVPSGTEVRNLCLDKGYDYDEVREIIKAWGYVGHIPFRDERKQIIHDIPNYRARRWVVERTHSWMNRFRRLLIRWEKYKENYLGMIHLACACIAIRAIQIAIRAIQVYRIGSKWDDYHEVREKMWNPYFSNSLRNDRGLSELSFPYVLRHTQMRPRQLIVLCNTIAAQAAREKTFPIFHPKTIVKAVAEGECALAEEVLNSYSSVYPKVGRIVEALSGLPMIFKGNELDKRAPLTASEWPSREYSPLAFRQFIAELGIVGRARRVDQKSGFVEADFEYSSKTRLSLMVTDYCVIHPMFYQRLNINLNHNLRVYPFPDHDEFKELDYR